MKKLFLPSLPVVALGALLCLDGYGYGVLTNRWHNSKALQEFAAKLDQVPMVIGDWQGEKRGPLSEREVAQAGFEGYLYRGYKNRQTGKVINVLLACGRPGPLSVHTPDVCYRGAGYVPKGIEKSTQESLQAEFLKGKFGKPDAAEPRELHVFWAWNAKGLWQAPANPRFSFAGAPALYKLYVIHESMRGDQQAESIHREFLNVFIPALDKSLFPPS